MSDESSTKDSASEACERSLDDVKMKNRSGRFNDEKSIDYLRRNRQRLIEQGIATYDYVTK